MLKLLFKSLLCLVLAAMLYVGVFFAAFFTFPKYEQSYQKAIILQKEALAKMDESKAEIVVVGGSDVAFSINAEALSKELSMPAKISGVHAGLGYSISFDNLKENIGKNDIIVLEYTNFKPDYYGIELLLTAFEGNSEMLSYLAKNEKTRKNLILNSHTFINKKITAFIVEPIMNLTNNDLDYTLSLFDKNGTMTAQRDGFKNASYYKNPIILNKSIINEDTIRYVNDFYDYCLSKGAEFYITFPPVYDKAILSSADEANEYESILREKLRAPVISSVKDSILPKKYIYNANLHCNTEGSIYYTKNLADNIKNQRNQAANQ